MLENNGNLTTIVQNQNGTRILAGMGLPSDVLIRGLCHEISVTLHVAIGRVSDSSTPDNFVGAGTHQLQVTVLVQSKSVLS